MTCPNCGAEDQAGQFCGDCGAQLRAECQRCGKELAAGTRFCAACGHQVAGGGRSRAHWWIAVAAAIVVVLILLIPERAERAGPLPMVDPGVGAPQPPAGFTGDPRTDADRLFNRVMAAMEEGRQEEVDQFMPMALQAYGMVPALDDDALFHVAILYEADGQYDRAVETAHEILATSPDHILALGVAGTASASAGDDAAAESYFRRLLDGYDAEAGRLRQEYVDHQVMVTEYRRIATEYLQAR